jgi:virginiamycin B lyase
VSERRKTSPLRGDRLRLDRPAVLLVSLATAWSLSAQTITEFPINRGTITDIAVTPDGNVWFTETNAIGRMTPSGTITEFPVPARPGRISAGPDGNLWFTELRAIGRITQDGSYARFPLPFTGFGDSPLDLTAGPDGKLWYITDISRVGSLTMSGVFASFDTHYNGLAGITAGPDGNIWFTTAAFPGYESKICRITPDGFITQFEGEGRLQSPGDIVAATDGNLWFTQSYAPAILGRVTPEGAITQFNLGRNAYFIAASSDANLWLAADNTIARVAADGRLIDTFHLESNRMVVAIARAPDDSLWFVESSGTLGWLSAPRSRRRTVRH